LSQRIVKYIRKPKHGINLPVVGDLIERTGGTGGDTSPEGRGLIIEISKDEATSSKDMLKIFWIGSSELTWHVYGDLLVNFEFSTFVPEYEVE